MSSPSTIHGIPIPAGGDDNDSVAAITAVISALEGGSIIRRLSQAQIDALTGPQKPAGLVVYNTTAHVLQVSDGTSFVNVGAPTYVLGTSASQSIPAGSETTLTYTGETDPASTLNTSTGIATLPSAGAWLVTVSLRLAVAADATGELEVADLTIYQGATEVARHTFVQNSGFGAGAIGLDVTALVVAAANDTIKATVTQASNLGGSRSATNIRFAAAKIGV
jgi:hypothetical protein